MFYKILQDNFQQMQYHLGLNEDLSIFDPYARFEDWIFFTDEKDIFEYCFSGSKIALIDLPENEKLVHFAEGYAAHQIIIKEIRELWSINTFEQLQEEGVDLFVDNKAYRLASERGNLEIMKWLCNQPESTIDHISDAEAFRIACLNNYLDVAKWLYSKGDIDLHINNDLVFREVCGEGHLEIAKWLYLEGNVDLHVSNDWVFKYSNSKVLDWIKTLEDPEID